jgi:hypothetical protein
MRLARADSLAPLYKYRSLGRPQVQENLWKLLARQELRFASLKDFNDPFDCEPSYDLSGTDEQFVRYSKRMLSRRPSGLTPELRAEIERYMPVWKSNRAESEAGLGKSASQMVAETYGIYCLTAVPNSILMWSHYARSHTGVCLEFDRRPVKSLFRDARKVRYPRRLPVARILQQTADQVGRTVFLRKAGCWLHEQEWRIVDSGGPGVRHFASELLIGVIFGLRTSSECRQTVLEWIRESKCRPTVFQAQAVRGEYRLVVRPMVAAEPR